MFPANTNYPKFVPDQLLTSDALNELFSYVDEQERMTRTNLVGVGIVCGLHVIKDSSGTSVTITKGTGVTTGGYLVSMEDTVYTKMKLFDHTKDSYFDDYASGAPSPLELWELKEASTEEGMVPLAGLEDMAVLLYVELLEEDNKTCDPNSCDDKGITVSVNFRPFLADKTVAQVFMDHVSNINTGMVTWFSSYVVAQELNEIKMRRFDIPNTNIITTDNIVAEYRSAITQTIPELQTACNKSYELFSVLLQDEYPDNPLEDIESAFDELSGSSISLNDMIHIQYYYDHLSDMIAAYAELRVAGTKLAGVCCPDSSWFPRHLLLGEVVQADPDIRSDIRHYFMYSPLFEHTDLWMQVKLLYKRLVLIHQRFSIPLNPGTRSVRITPSSQCCCSYLSKRSIPYYYTVKGPEEPYLYKYWNLEKREQGRSNQVLSYHAESYNTIDQFVRNPLQYDLECYDFLRVEGIVGKPYKKVLKQLKFDVKTYRLPVKVIALRAGEFDIAEISASADDYSIHDLEINYDVARREWEAVVGKTIEYLHDNQVEAKLMVGSTNWISFLKNLHKAKKFMVDSLPLFIPSYHSFMQLFETLERQATLIRNDLHSRISAQGFLINLGTKAGSTYDDEKLPLAEDLIDHLDDVVMAVKKGPFRALYQEYNNRVIEVYKKTFLSEYLKNHPGIQHKGGVPLGGTFILVYHSKPFELKKKGKTGTKTTVSATLSGIVLDDNGEPLQGVVISLEDQSGSTITNSEGRFAVHTDFLPAIIKASAPGFNDATRKVSSADSLIILNFSEDEDATGTLTGTIPDQTVIADFFLPYICCSEGQSINITIKEEPEPPNIPPVAKAGSDITITLPVNSLTIDGSSSNDPDGTSLKYKWTKLSGPESFLLTDGDSAIAALQGLIVGTYVFKLTVTDADGATHEDTVTVTVNPKPNILPVAEAGLPQTITLPTRSVLLDGSASKDPDGGSLIYLWEKISGGAATILTPASAQTVVDDLTTGTGISAYTFRLTVTDADGGKATDTTIITVNPKPLVSPVARIEPVMAIQLPLNAVTLDGSGSADSDGTIKKYEWSNKTGLAATIKTPSDKSTEVTGLVAGSYQFGLTVTDDDGLTNSATISFVVKPENQKPVANAGNDVTIMINKEITMTGTGRDNDGTIESYLWSQKSGEPAVIAEPENPKTVISGFAKEGSYVFTLTVTDNQGATGEDDVIVTVVRPNQPPVIDAGEDIEITLPENSVTLKGVATDADGTIKTIKWMANPGPAIVTIENDDQLEPTVRGLVKPGKYQFVLNVTDNNGASVTDSVIVTVTDATPPTVNAGKDIVINMPVLTVTLKASTTGNVTTYSWKQFSGADQATITGGNTPSPTISFPKEGEYEFIVTVVDAATGLSASDQVKVTVEPEQVPLEDPQAVIIVEPSSPIMLLSQKFTLIGSGSKPPAGGSIKEWKWTQTGGPSNLLFSDPQLDRTDVSNLAAGDYKVTLTVTADNGMSDSVSEIVSVTGLEPVMKTCTPLQDIVSRFDELKLKLTQEFITLYPSIRNVTRMFDLLKPVTSDAAELNTLNGIKFPFVAPVWLEELDVIIENNTNHRRTALVLYNIIESLAMQVTCIQDQDYNAAELPASEIFDVSFTHFLKWGAGYPDWTLEQQNEAKKLKTAFGMEINNVQQNGEDILKPEYFKALNNCLEVLTELTS